MTPRTTQRAGMCPECGFPLAEGGHELCDVTYREGERDDLDARYETVKQLRRTIEQQQARERRYIQLIDNCQARIEEMEAVATDALCDRNGTYCFTHLGHHQPVRVDDALRQALNPSTKGEGE